MMAGIDVPVLAMRPAVDAASHATLVDPLLARAEREPDGLALVFIAEDGTKTPISAATLHAARLAARGLERLSVAPDDVVILAMGHSEALIATFLGALHLGAVPSIFAYPADQTDAAAYAARVHAVATGARARAVVTTS